MTATVDVVVPPDPAARAWAVAAATPDPELPMVTVGDLGILRSIALDADDRSAVVAVVTPTYSGCPAMGDIGNDVRRRLLDAGFARVEVRTELAPAWTTDWITPDGRRKLAAAGVAPPNPAPAATATSPLQLSPTRLSVACPRCCSVTTERTADFAATACRALYRCLACLEPFEYVKER